MKNEAIEALKNQGFSEEKATEIFERFVLIQYLKDQGFNQEEAKRLYEEFKNKYPNFYK